MQTAFIISSTFGEEVKIENGLTDWISAEKYDELPRTKSIEELSERFYPWIETSYSSQFKIFYPETEKDFMDRASNLFEVLFQNFEGKQVLLVTHPNTLVALCRIATGKLDCIPSGLCKLKKSELGEWTLESVSTEIIPEISSDLSEKYWRN